MKKITAFFLLLLPIFITGLMFISGLIQQMNFPVAVVGISIDQSDKNIKWVQNDQKTNTVTEQFSAHVLPLNAKNQNIIWTTSNPDIATVNDEGKLTIKGYGKFMITATAAGNTSCSASREIDSYDTVVHEVNVSNKYEIGYLAPGSQTKPLIETSPSIDHTEKSTVTYSKVGEEPSGFEIDSETGIVSINDDETLIGEEVNIKVTVDSSSSNGSRTATTTVPVKIGKPLDTLSFDDTSDQTISEEDYPLFDHVKFGPAPAESITADDFIFESDNPKVATIGNDHDTEEGKANLGKIHFLKSNEFVTFTVSYRRNPDIKANKRLQTTTHELQEVFFTQSYLEIPYDLTTNHLIPKEKDDKHPEYNQYILNWYTYPQEFKSGLENVQIYSTNEDVVTLDTSAVGGKQLKMVNPGKCALIICVGSEDSKNKLFTDICEINVTADINKPIISDNVNIENNSYYVLRDNINLSKTSLPSKSIQFELDESKSSFGVSIDDNNILHFTSESNGTATVVAKVGEDTIGKSFTVTNNPVLTPITLEETTQVEVGQLIQLTGYVPTIEGKYYAKYFDVVDAEAGKFIPKRGCDIPDFEVTKDGQTSTIHLIVEEKPYLISSEVDPLYVSSEDQIDIANVYNAEVYPSSATKKDGSNYKPTYENYTFYGDCGSHDGTTLNFNKVGACRVDVNFGPIDPTDPLSKDLKTTYFVKSTFHDKVGKFTVTTNETLSWNRKVMQQYSTWDLDENPTLRIDDISPSYIDQLSIKSNTGLCTPTLTRSLLIGGHIIINANPITGKYGKDVIEISSPTYTLFLNVEIKPEITDFTATCKSDIWGTSTINTYTKNLSIRITPNTEGNNEAYRAWTWQLNDESKSDVLTGSQTIKLTDSTSGWVEGTNHLYLYNTTNPDKPIKVFTIELKDIANVKVSLAGCEQGIYATCYSERKSAVITPDGYVDDSFYTNRFEASLANAQHTQPTISKNVLTIKDMTQTEDEAYTDTLTFKDKVTKVETKYSVGRDTVSRIKLPGHNILDQSDKKGMQKVHVYGNYSWYPGIGEVNYYKVPVELYDNTRKLITGAKKLSTLKQLKITVGRNSSYEIVDEDKGDYIRVHFDKADLYSTEEMYRDAFDTKGWKNIDFQVATKSNEVHADYKFVAVEGTNVWDQEPIKYLDGYQSRKLIAMAAVMQKNFGLTKTDTDVSAKYDTWQYKHWQIVYGNGYCLDFKDICRENILKQEKWFNPKIFCAFNVDINGADNDTLSSRKEKLYISSGDDKDYSGTRYYAYVAFHNFYTGLHLVNRAKAYIKNSIFHNMLYGTLYLNQFDSDSRPDLYLENTSFCMAGGFPIIGVGFAPIHFKGDIGIYNFHDKEMLRHVFGDLDLTTLWPAILAMARGHNMIHKDYKGDEVINSLMVTALNPEIYFWDYSQNKYVKGDRGITGSAKYLTKYADISMPIPFVGRVGASMWGGAVPGYEPNAPSYFDVYDEEGKVRPDFLNKQITTRTRHPNYF